MKKCTKSHIQSSSNGVHCLLLPTQSKCDHLSPHRKSKTRRAKFPFLSLVCSFVHPPTPASNTQACPMAVFQGTASNATITPSNSMNLRSLHTLLRNRIHRGRMGERPRSITSTSLSGITPLPSSIAHTCPFASCLPNLHFSSSL